MTTVGLLEVARRVATTGEPHHQRNVPATGDNLVGRIVDVSVLPIDDGAVAMTFVDVTDQRAAETRLRRQADTDQLTGLWNRSRLRAELNARLERGEPTIVALLDLNRFKMVNDSLGHTAGDMLLQAIADRLGHSLPTDWVVARLGGDEFGILAPAERNDPHAVGRRLIDLVRQPAQLSNGVRMNPAASVGISVSPDDARSLGELLRFADTALYSAKRSGDDFRVCSASQRRRAQHQDRLFAGLDESFEHRQYEPYAQPIVDVLTRQIVGVELLARWAIPGIGVKLPAEFLPLLGMAGRTSELTDLMMEAGAELTRGGRFVSLNLAASDLYRTDLVGKVEGLLAATKSDTCGDLWFELVESELLNAAAPNIDQLIDRGARIAVDDFGAAFSSMQRIVEHDISVLKLDRALVAPLTSNYRARRVVKAVLEAAHDLGATVVAEGIEDIEGCEILEELGCDMVQGFYVGRPAPVSIVEPMLNSPEPLGANFWPPLAEIQAWEVGVARTRP